MPLSPGRVWLSEPGGQERWCGQLGPYVRALGAFGACRQSGCGSGQLGRDLHLRHSSVLWGVGQGDRRGGSTPIAGLARRSLSCGHALSAALLQKYLDNYDLSIRVIYVLGTLGFSIGTAVMAMFANVYVAMVMIGTMGIVSMSISYCPYTLLGQYHDTKEVRVQRLGAGCKAAGHRVTSWEHTQGRIMRHTWLLLGSDLGRAPRLLHGGMRDTDGPPEIASSTATSLVQSKAWAPGHRGPAPSTAPCWLLPEGLRCTSQAWFRGVGGCLTPLIPFPLSHAPKEGMLDLHCSVG